LRALHDAAAQAKRTGEPDVAIHRFARIATLLPDAAEPWVEQGLLHADRLALAEAEAAYRAALERDPRHGAAHLYLGLLYEHSGRADALRALIDAAEARGVPNAALALLRAHRLRRAGDYRAALAAAEASPLAIEPARRAQLIGELADRLGDGATAFAAFGEMNALMARLDPQVDDKARRYRERIEARLAAIPSLVAPPLPAMDERAPVFLTGLPRSGTTLLDTFLMGHPDVAMLEELPIVQEIEAEVGDRLMTLDDEEIAALRARYFDRHAALAGTPAAACVIDKHPLHIASLPLIRRLFPDARLIFIARHPLDIALSCYTTNFAINAAMANFLEVGTTAVLCDLLLRCWTAWRPGFAAVHELRYERLVEAPQPALRALLEFLDLRWRPELLDHRATAAARGYIASASYAQVGQAIHARSIGRWRRYRAQLAPMMPLLVPWVERLGYDL